MNRSTHKTTALPFPQPARLTAVLLGVLLLLMGGVPMAERLVAHLTAWTAGAPVPGLAWLLPFVAGVLALFLTLRRRSDTAGEARPQEG
ncbi:hypothetical protein ACGH52_39040 [Streptomyces sp. BBFR25]|uniref:hypothetical protein n=1 Tax=Streptomyces sp. BBFR25 TaxID=3372855 RepID=UPI0037DDB5EA